MEHLHFITHLGGAAPPSPLHHYGGVYIDQNYQDKHFTYSSTGAGPPPSFGGPSPHPHSGGM